jgi:transposase
VLHAEPRLSPWSRQVLVERVLAGRPAAHVAAEMGISRATAYQWPARFRAEGVQGLPLVARPAAAHGFLNTTAHEMGELTLP